MATGDFRHLPLSQRQTPPIKAAMHGAIYEWARGFVQGRTVLDLGCAEGLGSLILSESAASVVGVDWDSDLIEEARAKHDRPGISYEVADCQALEFGSRSFDVVVNNAMLEHVGDPGALMRTATQCLSAGGMMICGTRNSDLSFKKDDGAPLYDNHLQEYSSSALAELMHEYFDVVRPFLLVMSPAAERFLTNSAAVGAEGLLVRLGVKSMIPRSLRNGIRRMLTGVDLDRLGSSDFRAVPSDTMRDETRAVYVLAIGEKPRLG